MLAKRPLPLALWRGQSFPTPDVEKRMAEMAPTAVIVDGAYRYPSANSALDSDGDRRYTLEEWKQAMRKTYPAYEWPDAYTRDHRIP